MRRKARLIAGLFLICAGTGHAIFAQSSTRPDDFKFRRIGLEAGLPNEYVNCIVQDRFGYMWFGTKKGLHRFDGTRFRSFYSNPQDSASLSSDEVMSLFVDSSDRMWIGTAGGLDCYNDTLETFTRVSSLVKDDATADLRYVCALDEDAGGSLWIGTFGHGLFKLDPGAAQLAHVPLDAPEGSRFGLKTIYDLWSGRTDSVWVASYTNDLRIIDTRTGDRTRFSEYWGARTANEIHTGRDGRIWIGVFQTALIEMHLGDSPAAQPAFSSWPALYPGLHFSVFQDDLDGNLWAGTTLEGLFVLNPEKDAAIHLRHRSREPESITSNEILDIYTDRDGNVWVGTHKGVSFHARWRKPFTHVRHDTDDSLSIPDSEVSGLSVTPEGTIWLSTFSAGIARLGPGTTRFQRYTHDNSILPINYCSEILAADDGKIWVGNNWPHGLNRLDFGNDSAIQFLHDPSDSTSLASNVSTTLFQDSRGRIWVGSTNRGLNLYLANEDRFRRFPHTPENPNSLSGNDPYVIHEDLEGTIWIGTENWLSRIDEPDMTVKRFAFDSIRTEVYALIDDADGALLAGTNRGVWRIVPHMGAASRLVSVTGLPDNRILGLLADHRGNLWLQTTTAVARYTRPNDQLQIYDNSDGWIQRVSYEREWLHSYAALPDGRLVFGGSEGLTFFRPELVKDNPAPPPVQITSIRLQYEPVAVGDRTSASGKADEPILPVAIEHAPTIRLPHNQSTITFEFAALDYTDPRAIVYAYKMEGLQEEWSVSGNEQVATFIAPPPGQYTFRVRAANSDGLWNDKGASLDLVVLPPWWRTAEAFALYGFAGMMLLVAWRWFELRRAGIKHELKMRAFEARQLQEVDAMKSRFFANISHEFRTPLTLILGPLEKRLEAAKDVSDRRDFSVMHRNAERVLRLINQLLDLSKLEAGKMQLRVNRGDFVKVLRGVVMSFDSVAKEKDIALTTQVPKEERVLQALAWLYFDVDSIEQMLSNLLANAFKFTPEGGEVSVSLDVRAESENREVQQFARVRVHNTGPAIEPAAQDRIFDRFFQASAGEKGTPGSGIGLALTKELVELHRGRIRVQSEAPSGTCFEILLPIGPEIWGEKIIGQIDAPQDRPAPLPARRPLGAVGSADPQPEPTTDASDTEHSSSVLIIEDHADVRAFIRAALPESLLVLEAANGREGLDLALERVPDLVITDLMMPEIDGYGVCEQLKTAEATSHIPVIMLTAKAAEEDKLAGLETGADDYLLKPFRQKELAARVTNLIEQRRKLRERFYREGLIVPRETQPDSSIDRFLQRLMHTIEDRLEDSEFGVEQLGSQVGLGARQLHRKVRALTGRTPVGLIRLVRLQRARQLLQQKAGTVSEIAFQVGFSSLSYFAKSFKNEFGVLPSEIVSGTQESTENS